MDPEKVKSTLTDDLEKRTPSKSRCDGSVTPLPPYVCHTGSKITSQSSAGFFVCGLNLTLPEGTAVFKYIIRFWSSLADITRKNLPELVNWVKEQAGKTHMNIVASDLVTCADFVSTVIELNTKPEQFSHRHTRQWNPPPPPSSPPPRPPCVNPTR